MKVLYIGGTGEISYSCLQASIDAQHHCTVYNRGLSEEPLPPTTRQIVGDVNDPAAYSALAREKFDVVCQFTAYKLAELERDLAVFGGNCGQYVFISTTSAYQKPPTRYRITEDVPLGNPYWAYSQAKADMEAALLRAHAAGKIAATIVRPSHTIRRRFPGTFVKGDVHAWRALNGRPIISHGDGNLLWTLTHSDEFAAPFVKLLGRKEALGEAFHIASDAVYTWDVIFNAMAEALGVKATLVHVPAQTIIRYNPEWVGPLLGDKGWCTTFDHSKLIALTGPLPRPKPLRQHFASVARFYNERTRGATPDRALHALLDRIAAEQAKLGT
jgi:nucleoside-diphosphate-sugar epimerase